MATVGITGLMIKAFNGKQRLQHLIYQ